MFVSGNELPENKFRERRFLFGNIFGGDNDPSRVTDKVTVLDDSSLIDSESFCQGGCRDGWISYKGQCYMYVLDQMTWEEAEVMIKINLLVRLFVSLQYFPFLDLDTL